MGCYFELKEPSVGPPKLYFGGQVRKVELKNGVKAWSFGPSQYVQAVVKNIEKHFLNITNWVLPRGTNTPLKTNYCPELDVYPLLKPTLSDY